MRALRLLSPRLAFIALAALAAAGCGDAALKSNSFGPISNLITAVSTSDGTISASLVDTPVPAAGAGPVLTVDGFNTAVNGGSLRASVTSATPFDRVFVSLINFEGYFQLDLPAPVTSADVVVTLSPNVPDANLAVVYNASAPGGPLGSAVFQAVNLIRVGSGDVQVSVLWDQPTDVDLHVTDPNGEHVFFGNLTSSTGGTLDLDSNAACAIDGVNNENIVWPTGQAPSGDYQVSVTLWSNCDEPPTNYTVTVAIAGQPPHIYSGVLTSNGETHQIGTFTR